MKPYEALGWRLPPEDEAALAALPQPSPEDIVLLSRDLDGTGPWLENEITSVHLLKASAKFNRPIRELWQRLKPYEALGLRLPPEPE